MNFLYESGNCSIITGDRKLQCGILNVGLLFLANALIFMTEAAPLYPTDDLKL